MLIGMFSIIAYAGPLIINLYRIVKEKETKAKEGMILKIYAAIFAAFVDCSKDLNIITTVEPSEPKTRLNKIRKF